METCQNLIINSDASENVAYNHPDFPAYIKKRQLSSYSDFRAVSHWHDDLEFILILDGTMVYNVNGEKIPLQTGEGLFVNSRCLHYGYSGAHTECYFLCLLLSPALLSANTYFNQYFFNPLLQNVHFPYVKLSPTVQWQNLILHDLEILYDSNSEKIQAFIVLEKFAHICRLLYENMNHFPDHDKNTADLIVSDCNDRICSKKLCKQNIAEKYFICRKLLQNKMHFTFPKISVHFAYAIPEPLSFRKIHFSSSNHDHDDYRDSICLWLFQYQLLLRTISGILQYHTRSIPKKHAANNMTHKQDLLVTEADILLLIVSPPCCAFSSACFFTRQKINCRK